MSASALTRHNRISPYPKTEAHARVIARVLALDAVWDGLLGVTFCLVPWFGGYVGLSAARPWPVYVVVGVACLAFSAVLANGARSTDAVALCRLAAVGNAAAAVLAAVAAVVLGGPSGVALGIAAVGCAAFAVAEWRLRRP